MQTHPDDQQHDGAPRHTNALTMIPPRLLCIALAIALLGTILSFSAFAPIR